MTITKEIKMEDILETIEDIEDSINYLRELITDKKRMNFIWDGLPYTYIKGVDFSNLEFIDCNFDNSKFNKSNSFVHTNFKDADFFLTEFKENKS